MDIAWKIPSPLPRKERLDHRQYAASIQAIIVQKSWGKYHGKLIIFFLLVIIDAGCGCQTVSFKIGRNSGTNREWNIKVMQYGCGNDDVSGPPGCLQYYTATTGTIQSFNFPQPTVGTITETGTFKLSRFFALDQL